MKQAVVLIHGIGEQKPMSTLRGFVGAVLGPPAEGKDNYWNKPDPMSELFELRRLQSVGRQKTHFYEYYWAYNVEGTTVWHVLAWLAGLIRRSCKDVPASARALWFIGRTLVLLVVILLLTGLLARWSGWIKALPVLGIPWLVVIGAWGVFYFFLVFYLGDAARYCSASPQNITLRQTIRSEGLKLLRTLHQRGEYDRIIIVGHSLGSVIGYDLINRLWQEYHDLYPGLAKPETGKAVRDLMDANREPPHDKPRPQHELRNVISRLGEALDDDSSDQAVKEFQEAQQKVLAELQFFGNPWQISDFITVGCPLAHAMLLLADSRDDFNNRKRQREFPTCPPRAG